MKRILSLLAALAMVISMIPNVFAVAVAEMTVVPEKTELTRGEIVTFTISVSELENARGAGFCLFGEDGKALYDEDVFEFLDGKCLAENVLMGSVNTTGGKPNGVLAFGSGTKLSGEIFTFRMKVRDDAPLGKTSLTLLPSASTTAGAATVNANTVTLQIICNHTNDGYTSLGGESHSYTCPKCGQTLTEAHSWDAGVTTQPDYHTQGKKTFTCTKCSATKEEVFAPAVSVQMELRADQLVACRGDVITFTLSTEEVKGVRAGGFTLTEDAFDARVFEFVEGAYIGSAPAVMSNFDYVNGILSGSVAYTKEQTVSGDLFTFKMKVKEDAAFGETTIAGLPAVNDSIGSIHANVNTLTVEVTACQHLQGTYSRLDEENHTYTCLNCGMSKKQAHIWGEGVVTVRPTAGSKGTMTYTCLDCAAVRTEVIDALMTITADKTTLYRGDTVTFTISVSDVESARGAGFSLTDENGDLYDTNVFEFIDGTCPVPGAFMSSVGVTAGKPSGVLAFGSGTKLSGVIFTFRMKVRDDAPFSQTALTVVPSVSAAEGKLMVVADTVQLEVVCDHAKTSYTQLDAQTHIYTCQICGETKDLPHTWDAGTVTVAATCAAEGVMTYTCTDGCGAAKTEVIAKTDDHTYGPWLNLGENHKHICAVCQKEEIADHSYDPDKWESDAQNHWHVCVCGEKQDVGAHSFTEQVIDDAHATAREYWYYYDCAHCDVMGTETFMYGSTDGDEDVDVEDAIYLLQSVLMPSMFPMEQEADFDDSGSTGVDDAIYLLQHVLMPELFPLK